MEIRSQKYAKQAFGLVQGVKDQGDKAKEYRTLALNFPTMILQAGLAQAIGFLKAKGKDEHLLLLAHIAELLGKKADALHEEILNSKLAQYQLLTRQAIEAASSLKRYTQALLPKPKDGE